MARNLLSLNLLLSRPNRSPSFSFFSSSRSCISIPVTSPLSPRSLRPRTCGAQTSCTNKHDAQIASAFPHLLPHLVLLFDNLSSATSSPAACPASSSRLDLATLIRSPMGTFPKEHDAPHRVHLLFRSSFSSPVPTLCSSSRTPPSPRLRWGAGGSPAGAR